MKISLSAIQSPADLKKLTPAETRVLAQEIRYFLVDKVSRTGGHLAPNLGVVELTLALHRVFDTPRDKIVWDVGHQAYVHKILTGRQAGFDRLRQMGGLSGFPKREESEYDAFDAGHSSTSISAALGLAMARDLKGEDYRVAAVIGDGSLTGGLAFEGLNNAGRAGTDLLVILNDNEMSISKNVGALSRHLMRLRTRPGYHGAKASVHAFLDKLPGLGGPLEHLFSWGKDKVKYLVVPAVMFEELGFQYVGPVDGHDEEVLEEALRQVREMPGPVLLHVRTKKGKGYPPAERNPSTFHGVGPFVATNGALVKKNNGPGYSEVFGKTLVELAAENPQIVAITAAMCEGTGLAEFARTYPERFFDVGIAEQHAVTFAAGLAAGGCHPVFAVYSTFLQRGYDQLVHDVGMQNLPVVLAIDRAGIVGPDGETHQGVFDLSYLAHIPNFTVMAPKDGAELSAMLRWAFVQNSPVAVRYPKDAATKGDWPMAPLERGKAEVLQEGREIGLLALGEMVDVARRAAELLAQRGYTPRVVNLRFLKPLDMAEVLKTAALCPRLYTLEDNVETGGLGAEVARLLLENGCQNCFHAFAFPDAYLPQGTRKELFEKYGLDPASVARRILAEE